jgi:subtilisin family serine protease
VDHGFAREQIAQIGLGALHDSGYVGTGVLVCILDDGFNGHDRHEALRPVVIAPGMKRDFVEGDTTVTDTNAVFGFYHGTWVMGCVAGRKPGVYLGAGYGADIALARTENDAREDTTEMYRWAMGAEWADSLGADIISSSVGYFQFDFGIGSYTYADMDGRTTVVSRAAQHAASKGILVVNAVGNEGNTSWRYLIAPADVDGDSLIAVGAVDPNGAPAAFSSYGPNARGLVKPDLAARGVSTFVPNPYDTVAYETLNGTSFSAPLVAGLAACLIQARQWSPREIIRALRSTASRAWSPNDRVGYGIPDAAAALSPPELPDGYRTAGGPLSIVLGGPNPLRSDRVPLQLVLGLDASASGQRDARLRVVDASGRRVRNLWSGMLSPGQRVLTEWNGRDEDGRMARAGIYWIVLSGGKDRAAVRVAWIG